MRNAVDGVVGGMSVELHFQHRHAILVPIGLAKATAQPQAHPGNPAWGVNREWLTYILTTLAPP
jgi:hypothetical protein